MDVVAPGVNRTVVRSPRGLVFPYRAVLAPASLHKDYMLRHYVHINHGTVLLMDPIVVNWPLLLATKCQSNQHAFLCLLFSTFCWCCGNTRG